MKVTVVVRLAERARHLRALIGGVVLDALDRDDDPHLRHRERVRGVVRGDVLHGLPVKLHGAADRPLDLGEERVAQAALAIEVEDGDPHQGVGRHVEGRRVLPLIPLAHEIGDPGRLSTELSDCRGRAQRQLRLGRPGLLRRNRRRRAHELVDVEPDRERDDHDTGHDCQPPRNQGVHSNQALLPRCPPSQEQLKKVSASRTLLPDGDGVKGVSAAGRRVAWAAGANLAQRRLGEPKRALGTIRTGPAAATPAAGTTAAGVLLGIEPAYTKKEADEDEASEQRQPEHQQGLDRKDSKDRGDRTHMPRVRPLTHHTTPTAAQSAPRHDVESAPDRIRTCDLRFRRPTLYPTELRARARNSVAAPVGAQTRSRSAASARRLAAPSSRSASLRSYFSSVSAGLRPASTGGARARSSSRSRCERPAAVSEGSV